MRKNKQKLLVAFAIATAASFLLFLSAYFNPFSIWQLQLSDNLYGSRDLNEDIVIVAVDQNTISDDLGLGSTNQWSRSNYARVINNLLKFDPAVVGIDFFFQEPRDAQGDLEFKEALRKAEKAAIIYPMFLEWDERGFFIQKSENQIYQMPLSILRDLPDLTVATAVVIPDVDEVMRRMVPLIVDESSREYFESFPFALARLYLGNEQKRLDPNIDINSYSFKTADEEYEIPLVNGNMLINFSSLHIPDLQDQEKAFSRISFLDVFNENYSRLNESPEKFFKDKIVLIGPTSVFFKDYHWTPIGNPYKMSGIEIHANAVQTILDRSFLRNLSTTEQFLLIAILTFAAVFFFMYTRILWSLVFVVVVPAGYYAAAPFAFSNGIILDLVHPFLAVVVSFVAVYLYRYLTEFKSKMALKSAFTKFVNPTLAEKISENPEAVKLSGSKEEITVLFTDIANFAAIGEKLSAESLVAFLNEYLEAMTKVIMDEGGTVDKFEGDAIMAFFGAPIAQKNHAELACRTALKMQDSLRQLHQKWEKDPPLPDGNNKPLVSFRCGVSSGDAIVGNIGSEQKLAYTALGDIVNLGSRLEGANKKYETKTMISEETYEKVKNAFVVRELDIIRVKGKKQPTKVYELLGIAGQVDENAMNLLKTYNEGMDLYHARKYEEALAKFAEILKKFPDDGPSKLYRQRCDVLRITPPAKDWDGVYDMGTK